MMYETWAYRIHKFSDGIQEKFGGLFVASYLISAAHTMVCAVNSNVKAMPVIILVFIQYFMSEINTAKQNCLDKEDYAYPVPFISI